MTNGLEKMAEQVTWASKNAAYNLDFIPEDKLDWKPESTAPSAMEIANHIVMSFHWAKGLIENKEVKVEPTKSKEEVQERLRKGGEDYAEFLKSIKADELDRVIDLPWAKMPVEQIAGLAVIDSIHHRGQICYIQMLLGDTKDHFEM